MNKRSIAGEFTRSLLTATLFLVTLTGFLWIVQTQKIFSSEAEYVRKHESATAKIKAKEQVQDVANYISFQEDDLVSKINQQVQSRVNEGIQLATAIREQNKGSSTKDIQEAVINGLRTPRFFEGRGYYFINTLQGEVVLDPIHPEREGSSTQNETDARGQRIVEQDMNVIRNQGEGFVTGYWPRPQDPDGSSRLKISYIKRLDPFDWYIGTGEYYDDVKATVRQQIIRRYQNYGTSNGTRIFIIDDTGKELVPRYEASGADAALPDLFQTEDEKMTVIKEELAYSLSNPAGYGYLRTYTNSDDKTVTTAVYIRSVPRWGWIIGAEVPVETAISEEIWTVSQVRQRSIQAVIQILLAITFVFLAYVVVMRRQSLRLRSDFMAFMAFFKRAAKENVLIEVSDIQMQEFASMANMANQMVTKRQEAENALLASNEQLEIQVQERTSELRESLEILENTQEQLMQNEKLAVLGNLVTGITHEINIPVGIARSLNADLQDLITSVKSCITEDDPRVIELHALLTRMQEDADMVGANLNRTLELVHSFKEVSMDQFSGKRREFNLLSYLNEIVISLSSRIRKGNHHVEVICDSNVEIVGFPGALSQIVTNLIMNSLQHGFYNRSRGHITLEVIDGGERILLLYRDDGCGIPQRSIGRVFDPFFTTDRERGGSGLGLNIVHQLVTEKLGGTINLTSVEGHGVQFEIEFPRVQGE